MKKIFQNKKTGFTILETIFGIAIFLLIVGVLTYFSRNVWVYNSFVSDGLNDIDNGRLALKAMIAEIRTASIADTGAYMIAQASSTSFTFYSDIDDDGLKEKVRYFLSGSNLQKGIVKPTGSPLGYTGTETITTLVPYVTSATVFSYYDKNYDGTTAALSSPITIPSVRLVKITFTTDKDINRAPAATTFTTQISMRNLKDNL